MNPLFNAWKEGAILYVPWLLLGALLTWVAWPGPAAAVGIAFLVLGAFACFFFRDPPRPIGGSLKDIVAPADGAVVAIEDLDETVHYDGPCRRISIFLSLLDVHINRSPVAGVVRSVAYRPGRFRNAMKSETTDCNEATTIRLDTEFGPVTVRQIAGLVARRIVCRLAPGDHVDKGAKFGMIKFGSRTELYLPPDTGVCVTLKKKVKAGTTVIARFDRHEEAFAEETKESS